MGVDSRGFFTTYHDRATDEEMLMLAAFVQRNCRSLWVARPGQYEWMPEGRVGFSRIQPITGKSPWNREYAGQTIYEQDGDPIIIPPDLEAWEIHFYGRYYGRGYERGYWPSIGATLRMINAHPAVHEVWYGGDSSGCCAELVTEEWLRGMDYYFAKVGGDPYHRGWGHNGIKDPVCSFCLGQMTVNAFCGNKQFASCGCCGSRKVIEGNGEWEECEAGEETI